MIEQKYLVQFEYFVGTYSDTQVIVASNTEEAIEKTEELMKQWITSGYGIKSFRLAKVLYEERRC